MSDACSVRRSRWGASHLRRTDRLSPASSWHVSPHTELILIMEYFSKNCWKFFNLNNHFWIFTFPVSYVNVLCLTYKKTDVSFFLFCVGLKLCYWPEGKYMYGFCVNWRRNELYNVVFHSMCSEPDNINLKSRGIERVLNGGNCIQHFSLQTNLCVLEDDLESYGHLVGVEMIMILYFIDRGKFVEQLSNSWVLIKDFSQLRSFCFCCCCCCCNIVTAITKETVLDLHWQYH
jgi:hypothetical protein